MFSRINRSKSGVLGLFHLTDPLFITKSNKGPPEGGEKKWTPDTQNLRNYDPSNSLKVTASIWVQRQTPKFHPKNKKNYKIRKENKKRSYLRFSFAHSCCHIKRKWPFNPRKYELRISTSNGTRERLPYAKNSFNLLSNVGIQYICTGVAVQHDYH